MERLRRGRPPQTSQGKAAKIRVGVGLILHEHRSTFVDTQTRQRVECCYAYQTVRLTTLKTYQLLRLSSGAGIEKGIASRLTDLGRGLRQEGQQAVCNLGHTGVGQSAG